MFDSYDETGGVGFLDRIWDGAKVGGAVGGVLGLGVGAIPGAILGGIGGLIDGVGAQYQENCAYQNWRKNVDMVDDPLQAAGYQNRSEDMSAIMQEEARRNGDDPSSIDPDDVMKRMFRQDYGQQRQEGFGEMIMSCFGGLFDDEPAAAPAKPADVVSTRPQVAEMPEVKQHKEQRREQQAAQDAADYDKKLKAYDKAYREWAERDRAWGDAGKKGEAPGKPMQKDFGVTTTH